MANDLIDQALDKLDIDLDGSASQAAASLSSNITSWNEQNLSPQQVHEASLTIPGTVGGIPGIGSSIPGLGRIPLPTAEIPNILGPINNIVLGTGGEWEATHYASDLNAHHPKFKFLFKVEFQGFSAKNFYRYVHRIDKPKVRFNHIDVNYYNFRTRVLSHTTFDPLSVTFLDEIGNSVNNFFQSYLAERSGQGDGQYGIDTGLGPSTSSKHYKNGYSAGRRIIVDQIFANGALTNRFTFINPRIEAFDFDELNMEDSMGSLMTVMFSYDALTCSTLERSRINGWGQRDLLRASTVTGMNAGDTSGIINDQPRSATGKNAGPTVGRDDEPAIFDEEFGQFVPESLNDLVPTNSLDLGDFNQASPVGSDGTIVSQNVQESLKALKNFTI